MQFLRAPWIRYAFPGLVVLTWLAVAAVGGPTFGRLSSIATNDQASFLPASADSTKVQSLEGKFITGNSIPAIVVVSKGQQLSRRDFMALAALQSALTKVPGVASGPTSIAGPIPSKDGLAAEYIVQISGRVNDTIVNLRQVVRDHPVAGAHTYVAGPAGLVADLFTAFKGIDGILLYVALIAVFIILLLVYRSVVLPFVVLLTAMFALSAAGLVVYHSVNAGIFKLNGQSQGILSILAIGAATDYSLLIIARFRETLEYYRRPWEAMLHALRNSIEPVTASAATVVAGVLCLLFSELNSNKDLGPVAALGITFSYVAAMTFLPALLVLLGRSAFWPFRPKLLPDSAERLANLSTGLEDRRGLWRKVPAFITNHPRAIWLVCVVVLGAFALAAPQFRASGVSQTDTILGKSDAVAGQRVLEQHFPAGTGSPAVIIADASTLAATERAAAGTRGVQQVVPFKGTGIAAASPSARPKVVDGKVLLNATLTVPADSPQAAAVVAALRHNLVSVDRTALVGGVSAIMLDSNNASTNDLHKIIPIVLVVILVILMLLLRAIIAPVLLIGSVILSFTATIGVSALAFNHIFHFSGSDAAIPLFGFIFLVALGVDYNIFLMTRVREEAKRLGTRAGVLRGLSVTGSVITSAGVVLAATFAALAVVPILFLVQIAFIVAFGVLLDTIVVRSLLVPALCYDIARPIWWPSRLWRGRA